MSWKLPRRVGFFALLFAVYLVSTVPVGLFLYSMKSAIGFDLFKHGGLHAYMQCLSTSFPLSDPPHSVHASAKQSRQILRQ